MSSEITTGAGEQKNDKALKSVHNIFSLSQTIHVVHICAVITILQFKQTQHLFLINTFDEVAKKNIFLFYIFLLNGIIN